ncbi:3'-5' exonuclease [Staphylococcus gallinarum]|uniref:3'-5' exonuclease n=1 Tax=Staphylococcus gallinarum TaxID=1293 RepID=UPI001E43714D|nr:3'-5' exonuclease [Staphylococcus gallinarum]MCD8902491.1 3'-5' exoribonuclease [Staphylococcus gallinarum]MEB6236304.1 3'-5' exoribonuclease [Staphylococcus gallinarum]
MKKGLYWGFIVFSAFMLIGGISIIIENGLGVVDLLLLIFFISIIIFCLFKLNKHKKQKHQLEDNNSNLNNFQVENDKLKKQLDSIKKELDDKNNSLEIEKSKLRNADNTESKLYEFRNENNNLKKELNDVKKELKKKSKDLENEKSKQPKVIVEEKIVETESKKMQKNIDMLNMKLKLKEDYIQELEENQIINKSQNQEISEEVITSKIAENTIHEKPLDLSYTKIKKLTKDFVVLDFETTGLKYDINEIIQYGIVEFKDGIIVNEHTQYFKPDKPVGKTVMRKTGITNEFLENKPKLSIYHLKELLSYIEQKTIVAHNAPFDMKFLLKNLHDFNINHEKFRVFDTLTSSRKLINETPNHKLETLKNYFELDEGDSHQALNDARTTGKLALLLLSRMD